MAWRPSVLLWRRARVATSRGYNSEMFARAGLYQRRRLPARRVLAGLGDRLLLLHPLDECPQGMIRLCLPAGSKLTEPLQYILVDAQARTRFAF